MTRTLNLSDNLSEHPQTTVPTHFDMDFVAPHSPTEAAALLKAFVEEQVQFPVNTRLELKHFKNGSLYFCIQRSFYALPITRRHRAYGGHRTGRSNYVKVQVEGYLTGWADSGSTIVVGRGRILPKTYMVNGAFLLAFALLVLLLTTAFLGDFLCFAPVVLLMVASFAHTTVFQPEILGEKHKKTLIRQVIKALHG